MKPVKKLCALSVAAVGLFVLVEHTEAQYAANVASYAAGTTPAPGGYTLPASALGVPARITGTGPFDGVVSPFNPPYQPTDIVSIGEGGHLTLRLSNFAIPQAGAPEIGVFSNFGLVDDDYPNGQAENPAGGFDLPDSALVEVSANGSTWVSLGNVVFDIGANGYKDATTPFGAPGSMPSDFQQPFTGLLNDFSGLKYYDASGPDMLELLAGSGGGKWLDISGTGLTQVGYIRFSVADDGIPTNGRNFEIDGVSISHTALGASFIPEPATMLSALLAITGWSTWVRRRSMWPAPE